MCTGRASPTSSKTGWVRGVGQMKTTKQVSIILTMSMKAKYHLEGFHLAIRKSTRGETPERFGRDSMNGTTGPTTKKYNTTRMSDGTTIRLMVAVTTISVRSVLRQSTLSDALIYRSYRP